MNFYRVENDMLEGPYTCNRSIMYHTVNTDHYYGNYDKYLSDHPNPRNDPKLSSIWNIKFPHGDYEDYLFGFESLEKLFQWFFLKEDIEFLTENGFHVSIYETDTCFHGDTQSIAKKNSLKLIETLAF